MTVNKVYDGISLHLLIYFIYEPNWKKDDSKFRADTKKLTVHALAYLGQLMNILWLYQLLYH